jgi:DNA end-binding protein Ku
MAARAIWKGVIQVGTQQVPVKLYSAVEDRSVHFGLLDANSGKPVKQQLVNPRSNEVVEYANVQRGYKIDDGYVVLHRDELEALTPASTRDITISRFVTPQKLGAEWYVRPYFLGPDGDDELYFSLATALADERQEGVAHWVMRRKEYVGALREHEGYLLLITLRHAEEVIVREKLPVPEGRAHSAKELQMAEQLVLGFSDEFDPHQYRDEYRDRVLSFVAAKAQGKTPRLRTMRPKSTEANLHDALAKSLSVMKKERRVA